MSSPISTDRHGVVAQNEVPRAEGAIGDRRRNARHGPAQAGGSERFNDEIGDAMVGEKAQRHQAVTSNSARSRA